MWKLSRDLMDQFRPAFLFLVLGAALLLTAVLAYQAQDAARSHRRTAEAVLQEYALLAAREFVRRVDSDLGHYGVTLALQQLSDGESLPDPAQVGDTRRRALNLVKTFFRWNLERGPPQVRPDLAGAQLSPEVLEGLRRHAGSFDQDWTYALYLPPSQEDLLIFYRPISSLPRTGIEGFIADSEAVTWHFQKVMDGSPLLPLSPGKGVENSQLSLSVIGPSQEVIFRTWRSYYSPVSVDHDFGAGLKDLRLTIELDPKAAGQLVIGGLPGSRMLLLLGLLTLNSGLIVAALVQLRRDREFSRRQADFIAAVSHELRTPLAQIQMFTDTLLLERVRSPQEARRSLEIVSQETRRLAHLVENVIQFSRSLRQHTMLENCPQTADRQYLWILELAAQEGERKVEQALKNRIESGRRTRFQDLKEDLIEPVLPRWQVQVPPINIQIYDRLLGTHKQEVRP